MAGPNPNRLSNKRASVPFTRLFVVYMGRARSLDKLSSERERRHGSNNCFIRIRFANIRGSADRAGEKGRDYQVVKDSCAGREKPVMSGMFALTSVKRLEPRSLSNADVLRTLGNLSDTTSSPDPKIVKIRLVGGINHELIR